MITSQKSPADVSLARRKALVLMFDSPVPIDYGGVYDVMARVDALRIMGYDLEMLCTVREVDRLKYLNDNYKELIDGLFSEVHVIPARRFFPSIFSFLPLSVSIRNVTLSSELKKKLSQRKYDFVLVEHLKMAGLANRLSKLVRSDFYLRMHNDETSYYLNLAREARNLIKRSFFFIEGIKYYYYQKHVLRSNLFSRILFISSKDYYSVGRGCNGRGFVLPVAFNMDLIGGVDRAKKSIDFLYVGNLESDDNVNALKMALKFLSEKSLKSSNILICGRCRSERRQEYVRSLVEVYRTAQLEFNVTSDSLLSYYKATKIFINFSANSGGVKTKLADALSHDLIVLTNDEGVEGSGMDRFCINAKEEDSIAIITQLINSPDIYKNYISSRRVDLNEYIESVRASYLACFDATN